MSQAINKAYVTKAAPSFSATALMPDLSFQTLSLDAYKGRYLVLFFYPLDFTFVCPTEIIDFSDRSDEFAAIDCAVVAASVDSQFSHFAWVETPRNRGGLGKMQIPILSDVTRQLSRDYGVLLEDSGYTLRGLFIISPSGIIRHATLNDPPVGRNVDEVLRLVQAFRYTDEHGEVCPSGWTPGAATIKPSTTNKLAYFAAKH